MRNATLNFPDSAADTSFFFSFGELSINSCRTARTAITASNKLANCASRSG